VQPTDKALFIYSASGKIFNDKTLFRYSTMDKFFNKLRLLSAKAEAIIKSKQPAVPTAGISFYKISKLNNSLKAYIRQYKSKEKAEQIYYTSLEFSLTSILSFSLLKLYFSFSDVFSSSFCFYKAILVSISLQIAIKLPAFPSCLFWYQKRQDRNAGNFIAICKKILTRIAL